MKLISDDGQKVIAELTRDEWRALGMLCKAFEGSMGGHGTRDMGVFEAGVMYDLETPIGVIHHFINIYVEVNRLKDLVDILDTHAKKRGPTKAETDAALAFEAAQRRQHKRRGRGP